MAEIPQFCVDMKSVFGRVHDYRARIVYGELTQKFALCSEHAQQNIGGSRGRNSFPLGSRLLKTSIVLHGDEDDNNVDDDGVDDDDDDDDDVGDEDAKDASDKDLATPRHISENRPRRTALIAEIRQTAEAASSHDSTSGRP
ncbi:hypothetical protein ElyMa_005912500 [Elysia marginata]|uniref:Uncharacterized protein n=1 Tax=Elysia marginata TaxID=1093978 RepID=A0AAV4G6S6_9GAST|nr:hypothetical protein ElyMa_005912500 [Elysia marginata]